MHHVDLLLVGVALGLAAGWYLDHNVRRTTCSDKEVVTTRQPDDRTASLSDPKGCARALWHTEPRHGGWTACCSALGTCTYVISDEQLAEAKAKAKAADARR